MAKLFSSRRSLIVVLVVAGLLVAVGVVLAILCWTTFFWPYVIALTVAAALWFGLDFWLKARARRKQAAFDAAVAAKEGIDDRRREWASWTAELQKQGIDRHSLPFYLLLGEPQSGKSVLLQNSDLHFPFGQNRLSGIGGTRGCDWWFTEEAVILDLAGRLFTHEGGASDEAEWAAFLDLLSSFRPMCPANGVLLVLPCDGLLNDTPEQAAQKASRMQNALLTLTQRLQVQLPVYVVLTKGDKVFGFAETVHRLDTEKRHEMLGWSRPAEKVETPFSIDEARDGFAYLLARCRGLRAAMLGTARIPEALAEVDRLYAFPDELAQVQPSLEVYLRRIFTESQLTERLFFRGIYLTSGLQTGAPIVKACAALLGRATGGAAEADARNLESLFAKQRAYFIKDLVRKRLFEERGVVRPTRQRVIGARRNAIVGYGVGGLITALMIAAVATYSASASSETRTFEDVAKTVRRAVEPGSSTAGGVPRVLDLLERLKSSATTRRPFLERVMPFELGTSRDNFEDTYVAVFDSMLPVALRTLLEGHLLEQMQAEPGSFNEFYDELRATTLLQRDLLTDEMAAEGNENLALLARVADKEGIFTGADGGNFDLRAAVATRKAFADDKQWPASGPGSLGKGGRSEALQAIDKLALERMDGALDFTKSWHVVDEVGRFVAWVESKRIYAAIQNDPGSKTLHAHDNAKLYLELVRRVCVSDPGARKLKDPPPSIDHTFEDDLKDLAALREELREGAGLPKEEWRATVLPFQEFKTVFGTDLSGLTTRKKLRDALLGKAATASDRKALELAHEKDTKTQGDVDEFLAACRADVLPDDLTDLAVLPNQTKAATAKWLGEQSRDKPVGRLTLAKIHSIQWAFLERFPAHDAAEAATSAEQLEYSFPGSKLAMPVVVHLVELRGALLKIADAQYGDWITALNLLLEAELARVSKSIPAVTARNPYVDQPTLAALRNAESASAQNLERIKVLAGAAR
ncbi:MAG: hypothetical protein EXR73_14985, partial [Myxococcales bacterium]|nr:hypothetical protein [Myxococcales bacterium]